MFSPNEIQNLRQLLSSNDSQNVTLALMLLEQEPQAVINTFKEEIFLIRHFAHYLSPKDKGQGLLNLSHQLIWHTLKGKACTAFQRTFLRRGYLNSEEVCVRIVKEIHGTCFNAQRFAMKLYDIEPDLAIHYLLQYADDLTQRDLLLNYVKADAMYLPELRISAFPKGIQYFDYLKILVFRRMKLEDLPKEFSELKQLEVLLMDNNGLREFPKVLYELPQLRVLNLAYNHLRALPSDIGKMQALKMLDISSNSSFKATDALGDLKMLEILKWTTYGSYVSSKMTEVPNILTKLGNLKSLDLSGHDFHALPDSFAQLQNLNDLNLNGAAFRAFPEVLTWLPKLRHLSMTLGSQKRAATLSSKIGALNQVEKLDLSYSCFDDLPTRLVMLPKLKKLNLKYSYYKNKKTLEPISKSFMSKLLPKCEVEC